MKYNKKQLLGICIMIALSSCKNHGAMYLEKGELAEDTTEIVYQDQAELNEICGKWCLEYNDSIERIFQKTISALPQYKDDFDKEKAVWVKYQEVVREVAGYEDHGSSTSMYIDDMLCQGIRLREKSLRNLYKYTKGIKVAKSKTQFTSSMIDNAYSAFIEAVGNDEYIRAKEDYQKSLRKEQKCWNEWMECRAEVSGKLSSDIRKFYDDCTNLTMRTKLFQLKNQNQGEGMTSGEIIKCLLQEDCSDKALLNYPGFDKVWAKHCENTDWYPKFK